MPKRWTPTIIEQEPPGMPLDILREQAAAWSKIWEHTRQVAPMPVPDPRSALQYVLDLISKGAQSDA